LAIPYFWNNKGREKYNQIENGNSMKGSSSKKIVATVIRMVAFLF
jgi:hypothetical protein